MFGPERSFVLTANVYDCPYARNIQTVGGKSQTVVSTPSHRYGVMY